MLDESVEATRYSVEVNYRTTPDEALDAFAKIALGYVSGYQATQLSRQACLHRQATKGSGFIRNWDDGEWVVIVSWNHEHRCFVVL